MAHPRRISRRSRVKFLNNWPVALKLGVLVCVTLIGLCAAGFFASRMMQNEMFSARKEQLRAIVDTARNMAIGYQKQVEAGKLTKDAAIEQWVQRVQNMTYDNGAGYMFVYTMDGIAVAVLNPKQIGTSHLDVEVNGRKSTREMRDGVAAKGDVTINYFWQKPGLPELSPKVSYAAGIPGWNMFVGTGAYTALDGGLPGRELDGVQLALPFLIANARHQLGTATASDVLPDLKGKRDAHVSPSSNSGDTAPRVVSLVAF